MCAYCKVSRFGYYKWIKHQKKFHYEDLTLSGLIRFRQEESEYTLSAKAMAKTISLDDGQKINHKRCLRIMRENGLLSVVKRHHRAGKRTQQVIGEEKRNLIRGNHTCSVPFDKLYTDITEFRIGTKRVYLSSIKDMYTKMIEAYSIGYHPTTELVKDTINQVIEKAIEYGTFIHSDQGTPYFNREIQDRLAQSNFIQSMSRRGKPTDNSPIESFHSILKSELVYNHHIQIHDDKQLIEEIHKFIFRYNNKRRQKGLKWLTPAAFKEKEMNHLSSL